MLRIALATRHWMATLLQARIQNPCEKSVSRVECSEHPDQRRESLAAAFAGMERESSPDPVIEPGERIDATQAESVFEIKQEDPSSPSSIPHMRTRGTARSPVPSLHGVQDQSAPRATAQSIVSSNAQSVLMDVRTGRSARTDLAPNIAQEGSVALPTSSKRKRTKHISSNKRVNASSDTSEHRQESRHMHEQVQKQGEQTHELSGALDTDHRIYGNIAHSNRNPAVDGLAGA